MISTDSLRKIDTLNTKEMTEEDLMFLRSSLYESANLLFENWSKDKLSSKNPNGLLTINKNNI